MVRGRPRAPADAKGRGVALERVQGLLPPLVHQHHALGAEPVAVQVLGQLGQRRRHAAGVERVQTRQLGERQTMLLGAGQAVLSTETGAMGGGHATRQRGAGQAEGSGHPGIGAQGPGRRRRLVALDPRHAHGQVGQRRDVDEQRGVVAADAEQGLPGVSDADRPQRGIEALFLAGRLVQAAAAAVDGVFHPQPHGAPVIATLGHRDLVNAVGDDPALAQQLAIHVVGRDGAARANRACENATGDHQVAHRG